MFLYNKQIPVVYFNQLSGVVRTRKLVGILFMHIFNLIADKKSLINVKNEQKRLKTAIKEIRPAYISCLLMTSGIK